MPQLAGKVAIVTGASRGMGRQFVAALVDRGMRVACVARPSPELDALRDSFGDRIGLFPCDIAQPDAVNATVDGATRHFGRLDALINNAAIFHPFAFENGTDALIRSHVDVNILGTTWMIRAAIPHLRATRGQIVNISSESVRMPFPMLALYAATKAAVESLSQGLRDELRADGIRVSILRSGSVAGGSGSATWSTETTQAFYRKIVETGHAAMTGTPAQPESMAAALIAILVLPPDINADLIEVRAAHEGMPAGARTAASSDA